MESATFRHDRLEIFYLYNSSRLHKKQQIKNSFTVLKNSPFAVEINE